MVEASDLSGRALLLRRWPYAVVAVLLAGAGAALMAEPVDPNPIEDRDYSKQYNYVIRAGHETEVLSFLDLDPHEPGPVPGVGYWAENIEIQEERIRVQYWSMDGRKQTFVIYHPNAVCGSCVRSGNIGLLTEQENEDSQHLADWLLADLGPEFTALWQERVEDLGPVQVVKPGMVVVEPPRWFGRHPAEIWLIVNQVLWIALSVLLAWSLLSRISRRGGVARAAAAGAALVSMSLILRAAVATWGPGDLFVNVAEVFWGQPSTFYGNAPNGLLLMILRVAPSRIETLIVVNMILGSLAVGAAWLLAAELDPEDRRFPWIVALIVSIQPVLVRFSGEANRQMYVLALGAVGLWSWLRWARTGRALDALLAAVAATLCAHCRPEAFPILLLMPLAILLRIHGGVRRPWSWAVVGVTLAGYATYYWTTFHISNERTVYVGYLFTLENFFLGPKVNLWLDTAFTPSALIASTILGLCAGLLRRRRWVAWATVGLLGLAFIASSMPTGLDGGRQLASARYQTLAVLIASLVAGYGASFLIGLAARRGTRAAAAATAVIAVAVITTGVAPFRGVTKATTLDHEYNLMKEWILELPLRAEIYQPYSYRYNDLGLRDVVHLSQTLDRTDINWFNWPEEWRPSPNPQFFWRQASCGLAEHVDELFVDLDRSTPALAETCNGAAEHFAEHRILHAEIPFRAFLNADRDRGTLEVGMYTIPPDRPPPADFFQDGMIPKEGTPR